ncbi:MAG: hypothetical protein AAB893_02580 [Patescibacteria group bacterium]
MINMNVDTVQIIVIVSLSISTIFVTVIGIQVIILLRDIQVIVRRVTNISNGFNFVSRLFEKSVTDVEGFMNTVRSAMHFLSNIKHKNEGDKS